MNRLKSALPRPPPRLGPSVMSPGHSWWPRRPEGCPKTGQRVIVLFEGRDTAGKIAFFDCTCFGRAGVERVMGSCKPLEYLEFLRQSPAMERMLDRWDDYTEAKKAMFFHTDTADAP